MSIAAHKDGCDQVHCNLGPIDVKTRQYDDKVSVDTTLLGAYGCFATVDVSIMT